MPAKGFNDSENCNKCRVKYCLFESLLLLFLNGQIKTGDHYLAFLKKVTFLKNLHELVSRNYCPESEKYLKNIL